VLATLNAVIERNADCLRNPAPKLAVCGFVDGNIMIAVRPWVPVSAFNAAASDLRRAIVMAFRAGEIALPPPNQEVRLLNV
jgi:small-conductance mechanosensitive channel